MDDGGLDEDLTIKGQSKITVPVSEFRYKDELKQVDLESFEIFCKMN